MTPPDPRDRPDLERALPDDADPDAIHSGVGKSTAGVLFGDGTWRTVQVLAWEKDRHGRWRCLIEWGTLKPADTFEGWFLYDPERMRDAEES